MATTSHVKYGKMSELTQHWGTRHPAFRKPPPIPKNPKSLSALAHPAVWVITEKIHGANMSFVVLNKRDGVRCAKREELLEKEDDFFGYQRVQQRHSDHARAVFDKIDALVASAGADGILERLASKAPLPAASSSASSSLQLESVTIYGELFGGGFPGMAPAAKDIALVQEGLYYSNDLHFCCFDVAISVSCGAAAAAATAAASTPATTSTRFFCDFLPAMELLQSSGFFCAQPLKICSYEDCNSFDISFRTTIPSLLGVPRELQDTLERNFAEGVVCRTNISQFVPLLNKKQNAYVAGGVDDDDNDAANELQERTLFKRKITKFAAVCDQRSAALKAGAEADSKNEFLAAIRASVLTDELYQSAVSKTGAPNGANKAKIQKRLCELLFDDVLEQIEANEVMIPAAAPQNPKGRGGGSKAGAAASASAGVKKSASVAMMNQCREEIRSMCEAFVMAK